SATGVVNSIVRYARRVSSVDSMPTAVKRLVMVGVLSSAATMHLPGAVSLLIVDCSSSCVFIVRSFVEAFGRRIVEDCAATYSAISVWRTAMYGGVPDDCVVRAQIGARTFCVGSHGHARLPRPVVGSAS